MLCARSLVIAGILPLLLHAEKAPLTHETLWLMKRVSAPVVSPDGQWVVFTLTEPSYDEKEQKSDLWLVRADGTATPRRLTFTKGPESGAAWSPDSRRIAFVAKREGDEVPQVYVISIEGGEAVRITDLSTGASAPIWSPDGKRILFTSNVYPGAGDDEANRRIAAERKARKYSARVYNDFPIRNWDKWLDDRRPHLFVQDAEPGAKAKDLLAGSRLASEAGFGGALTTTGEQIAAVWAPDGKSIVFAATRERHMSAYLSPSVHLFQVPVSGGEPRQLTRGAGRYDQPAFRPDGKALYALHETSGEKVYYLNRLVSFSWPQLSAPETLTADFDRSVESFSFSGDGREVFFLAEDEGLVKVFRMGSQGGGIQAALPQASGVYSSLSASAARDRTVVTALWESAVNPAEVVRLDWASQRHQPLTEFNVAAAAQIDWQPPRHFWFTSKRGKKIHNMLVLPPAFDESKKYPLLVLMHGGPHNMWRDQITLRWNYHLLASPGYVVLLTNYTGSTGFGERFAQDIQFDPLKGPAEEINEAADEAIRRFPFIDGSRQAAAGASYGGHLANWMQASTTRYKCLISHAGLINLESQWGTSDTIYHREKSAGGPPWEQGAVWREQNPIRFAAHFKTPILVTVGENDFRVPLNQSIENWSALQRMRAPSRLIVFPDENHWILKGENSRFWYGEVHAWLAKHLLGN